MFGSPATVISDSLEAQEGGEQAAPESTQFPLLHTSPMAH
jgi:hypothetical protein